MHYEDWWCKKIGKPPALRSPLPTDEALEMNCKLSHYVAFMWKNCVTGKPPQLNSCEYAWEGNEKEESLRPTMLPAGIKISPDEILQTTCCKCVSTEWKKINAAMAELDLTVRNSVIVSNAMIKLECTWMIMKLRMKIMIVKVAQKRNNLLDMISLFVVVIWFDYAFLFSLPITFPILNMSTLYLIC